MHLKKKPRNICKIQTGLTYLEILVHNLYLHYISKLKYLILTKSDIKFIPLHFYSIGYELLLFPVVSDGLCLLSRMHPTSPHLIIHTSMQDLWQNLTGQQGLQGSVFPSVCLMKVWATSTPISSVTWKA